MRYGLVMLGSAVCMGMCQGWLSRAYDHVTTAALTQDARLAIDVRCRVKDDHAARECRSTLKRLYLARALNPDITLRTYCDSVKHAWVGGARPAPPELCVQRYGGWQAG
jgi:hypothetical protein